MAMNEEAVACADRLAAAIGRLLAWEPLPAGASREMAAIQADCREYLRLFAASDDIAQRLGAKVFGAFCGVVSSGLETQISMERARQGGQDG